MLTVDRMNISWVVTSFSLMELGVGLFSFLGWRFEPGPPGWQSGVMTITPLRFNFCYILFHPDFFQNSGLWRQKQSLILTQLKHANHSLNVSVTNCLITSHNTGQKNWSKGFLSNYTHENSNKFCSLLPTLSAVKEQYRNKKERQTSHYKNSFLVMRWKKKKKHFHLLPSCWKNNYIFKIWNTSKRSKTCFPFLPFKLQCRT